MINFKRYTLSNGLTFLAHRDTSTPIATINLLYKVGARNEHPDKTGFAHLFEHLMFGGSVNIPFFDEHLQMAGGENNAFTNNDYTDYYISLPKENIETALWLESDRMLELAFSQHSLDTQKSVVIEEFNQRYLNQPYGDIWLHLRPLAYKAHPYQWATIGKDISHIQQATLNDVKSFFYNYYSPNNAILSIVADIDEDEMCGLVEKWFGDIPYRPCVSTPIPAEPKQTQARSLTLHRNVPANVIVKAYHMCNRKHPNYYICDLLTDVLSSGKSSRLYNRLVQQQPMFSHINAYITGEIDEGLIIVSGNLLPNVDMYEAEKAIVNELQLIASENITDYELEKVKNKVESMQTFSEIQGMNKAMNLCYYEMLGDISVINNEIEHYRKISANDIRQVSATYFVDENCSTLYYLSENHQV